MNRWICKIGKTVNEKKSDIIAGIVWFFTIAMIALIVMASRYSILSADDFSSSVDIGLFHADFFTYAKRCVSYAAQQWKDWQGTYFTMLFGSMFSPLNHAGLIQLKIMIIIFNVSLFGSLILFLLSYSKEIGNKIVKALIVFSVIFCMVNYEYYEEVFYWYAGAAAYSVPLTMLFLALVSVKKVQDKKSILQVVISIVLGFCAMGGSLAITGAGCYGLLLYIIYMYISTKKIDKKRLVVFGFWFAFASLNAFAPGNFVRHYDTVGERVHFLTAIKDSIILSEARFQLLISRNFVLLIVIIFICGYVAKACLGKAYRIISVLFLLLPIVSVFPVVLGYGGQNLPNRCAFILDLAIVLAVINIAYVLGDYIKCKIRDNTVVYKNNIMIFVVIAFICAMLDGYSLESIKGYHIATNLSQGVYRDYNYLCGEVYNKLENYPDGAEVYWTDADIPAEIEGLHCFTISEDPEKWLNKAISEYYNLKLIQKVYN